MKNDAEKEKTEAKPPSSERHRLQVDLGDAAWQQLGAIAERQGLSRADVVRNALRVFDWITQQVAAGGELVLVKGETEKSVQLFF